MASKKKEAEVKAEVPVAVAVAPTPISCPACAGRGYNDRGAATHRGTIRYKEWCETCKGKGTV